MRNSSSGLLVVLAVLSLSGRTTAQAWKTLWKDSFTGRAGQLPTQWLFDLGNGGNGWGNNQVEYDTNNPDNVSLDGKGNLKITPLRSSSGNWTSARITTKREDFRPPKGGKMAMEGRIRLPDVTGNAALGYWPAFWALGSPLRHGKPWPSVGEIDMLENVNGVDKVWGTLHCGVSPGGPCNEPTGLGQNRPCPGKPCAQGFHVYRFEWDETTNPKEFRWYVDGQQYHKLTSAQIDAATWKQITDHPGYFIILNVAMGGNFPNGVAGKSTPTSATEPGHSMLVDYVAVYTS